MVHHATDQGVTCVARKGDVLFLSQQRRHFTISAALHDGSSTEDSCKVSPHPPPGKKLFRLMHGSLFSFYI
jgi:hypothetical protein